MKERTVLECIDCGEQFETEENQKENCVCGCSRFELIDVLKVVSLEGRF